MSHNVVMIGSSGCPWCQKAKDAYGKYSNVKILMDEEGRKHAKENGINVNGVPHWKASNGKEVSGFMPPEKLEASLNMKLIEAYRYINLRENYNNSQRWPTPVCGCANSTTSWGQ